VRNSGREGKLDMGNKALASIVGTLGFGGNRTSQDEQNEPASDTSLGDAKREVWKWEFSGRKLFKGGRTWRLHSCHKLSRQRIISRTREVISSVSGSYGELTTTYKAG